MTDDKNVLSDRELLGCQQYLKAIKDMDTSLGHIAIEGISAERVIARILSKRESV